MDPRVLVVMMICGTFAFCACPAFVAHRRGSGNRPNEPAGELQEDVTTLREELEGVRREVADLAERVDFAERLLAKQRDAERIAPPKS